MLPAMYLPNISAPLTPLHHCFCSPMTTQLVAKHTLPCPGSLTPVLLRGPGCLCVGPHTSRWPSIAAGLQAGLPGVTHTAAHGLALFTSSASSPVNSSCLTFDSIFTPHIYSSILILILDVISGIPFFPASFLFNCYFLLVI